MGIDWGMFEDDKLEMILLGIFYRTRHSQGYRRPPGELAKDVDKVTGLPKNEALLLPLGHAQWIPGIQLALESPLRPDVLATGCLGLYWVPRIRGMTPEEYDAWTSEQGRYFSKEMALRKEGRKAEAEAVMLDGQNASMAVHNTLQNWTKDQLMEHAELTYRWKKCLERFAEKGWVVVRPPVAWTSDTMTADDLRIAASGRGRDGLPRVAQATYKGIDEAERRIPGTKFAKGAFSALACAPDNVVAHAIREQPWAMAFAKSEKAGA